MIRAALLWLVLAFPLCAQQFPALYDVVGVRADDVLNVRQGPAADRPILGTLGPDATDVEVVGTSPDGRWALVNIGERAGWASLTFLRRQDGIGWTGFRNCFGTEPFWRLETDGESARLSVPEETLLDGLFTHNGRTSENLIDRRVDVAVDESGQMTAFIRREACGDGMSDRQYGLSITLHYIGTDSRVLSGCCSLR
ncbi:COG3650 family protein [Jannaschia aquimarina]|uniref:Bacterial SH3 domain protein n=1 Tax=Jannaschia aquimarina TaxID=935700 RepID=A0A0D1D4V6_9RHOB|nr:SH3 domain-containing protein [Jannaschia aquimarina]KIT15098.1 Bacterial SH3 domain protein [Jannaschia aquimarina]SNS64027.1 hypothetical protein SAMN05421775_101751 [Jannaschia aquimarina]